MGQRWNLPVETLPIGFKYIAPRFLEIPVLVGGEESGGIAVAGHIFERDGIYVGLLLLDMLRQSRQSLSSLVDEFIQRIWSARLSSRRCSDYASDARSLIG